jgi:hypothetical protein
MLPSNLTLHSHARRRFGWVRALALAATTAAALAPARPLAFWNVAIGDPIRDRDLPALEGGRKPLLGHAQATVFVLFRPHHDLSLQTLSDVARLQSKCAANVRFVAVTSGSYPPAAVRDIVRKAGLRATVLLDQRDALAEELGTDVRPVVAIVDEAHRLVAYQPYLSVNMHDTLWAELRKVLDRGVIAQR